MGGREVSRPYRVGFSPKASGFYPFGDATALAGEGGDIAKRLFFMFLFLCPSPMVFPLIPQKTCTRFSVFGYISGDFMGD